MAQVEHGQLEQFFFHQVEDIDNASSAAVAVGKGGDGFELIVENRHFDQGVEAVLVMHELFEIGQFIAQQGLRLRGGV